MMILRKRQGLPSVAAAFAAALAVGIGSLAATAETAAAETATADTAPDPAPDPEADGQIERLLAELAEPDRDDWRRLEAEIVRLWSRSGSDAMDLLLRRGTDALDAEDLPAAVEHLSALIDHAPDFAEGWNARATAFYMMGEYTLAIADVERALALNPRHFGALSGLGVMLEEMGEDQLALEAQRAAHAINPHRPELQRAIERLERRIGGAEL